MIVLEVAHRGVRFGAAFGVRFWALVKTLESEIRARRLDGVTLTSTARHWFTVPQMAFSHSQTCHTIAPHSGNAAQFRYLWFEISKLLHLELNSILSKSLHFWRRAATLWAGWWLRRWSMPTVVVKVVTLGVCVSLSDKKAIKINYSWIVSNQWIRSRALWSLENQAWAVMLLCNHLAKIFLTLYDFRH